MTVSQIADGSHTLKIRLVMKSIADSSGSVRWSRSDMAFFGTLRARIIVGEKSVTRIAALALMIGALCGTAMSQQTAEFSSYYSGSRYDFRLAHEQLSNTPAWSEDEPNPPLSPRAAQTAALSYLETLFDNATAWRLEEIKLVPVSQRWVYVVSFTPPPPPNIAEYVSPPFSIAVTMDGNAVTAVMSRWKPPTPRVSE